jgi:hypothetical protein
LSWLFRNRLPIAVILASAFVIAFWNFRHTENRFARRVFSVGNVNDFSWRNRVTTWGDMGRMMAARPLAGFGWSDATSEYQKKFKSPRLADYGPVQLNDYLNLGIKMGVPALLLFAGYIRATYRKVAETTPDTAGSPVAEAVHPPAANTPAAAALVLLIGFWFDGGLFKLPTSAVFWALIELAGVSRLPATADGLARTRLNPEPAIAGPEGRVHGRAGGLARWDTGLRRLAGLFALAALGLTALHLGTPQLRVSERTLNIARKHLVPPGEKRDFEYLAAKPVWSGKPLKTLLQHAHLANYNRSLVNWKLEETLYREFVLSPEIDPAFDGPMNWRRPLWESCYPRIRNEAILSAAVAEMVVQHLRERVAVSDGGNPPADVQAAWERQVTSAAGFERICVAGLRSAGIPARLSAQGAAEFWNGVEWRPAATP